MTLRALLDVATVLTGDGDWTKANGREFDDLACGRVYGTADVCNPPQIDVTDQPAGTGFRSAPFVIHAEQEFGTRCEPADAEAALTEAMEGMAEYVVARQLWLGDVEDWVGVDDGVYFEHADVPTVSPGANVPATIAKALAAAYLAHPEMKAVVHLGLAASYSLPPGFTDDHPSVTFVEGIGYPVDGVAVTGPLTVRLGSIETLAAVAQDRNRRYVSGTRLAAVEFGPCTAVRVA